MSYEAKVKVKVLTLCVECSIFNFCIILTQSSRCDEHMEDYILPNPLGTLVRLV